MCGIAGQYYFKGQLDRDLILRMSEILTHRGPDASGYYFGERIGLAHRRLSIIDLSEQANQPMFNKNKSIAIVYNGELYNYKPIRETLKQIGYKFKTQSDTEVVLHAYEEFGMNCLTHFNGMWAFAIWDSNKEALFCARDRFGIKPFYYTVIDNTMLFASEIKALLAHPKVGLEPNEFAVEEFLSTGCMDETHITMFHGIYQIPPSEGLLVNEDGIRRFQYCDLDINPNINFAISDDDVSSVVQNLLKNSIKLHLQSDVPVGTCLSGGIDSSTIVKLTHTNKKQHTFSACFKDKRFDESNYIKLITIDKSIEPHYVEPNTTQLLEDLDDLIYMQDEPFGSLSIYAQYCVMREAQKYVKVLLDGQGADELFGGYLAYQKNYIQELLRRKKFITAFKELTGSILNHSDFYSYAIKQVVARGNRKKLLKHNVNGIRYKGNFSTILHNELFITNLPALLHYEDRNSMAFSIEARVPYLDMDFVNYVAFLPFNQKIRNGVSKFALRNAIKGIIPEEIRNRRDKMGFVTPEEIWMKTDLKDLVMNILESKTFKNRKFWDSDKVLDDYKKFVNNETAYSPELWRIICTELWLIKFFDDRSELFT